MNDHIAQFVKRAHILSAASVLTLLIADAAGPPNALVIDISSSDADINVVLRDIPASRSSITIPAFRRRDADHAEIPDAVGETLTAGPSKKYRRCLSGITSERQLIERLSIDFPDFGRNF